MTRASMSRPRLSVPSGWWADGGESCWARSTALELCGQRNGPKITTRARSPSPLRANTRTLSFPETLRRSARGLAEAMLVTAALQKSWPVRNAHGRCCAAVRRGVRRHRCGRRGRRGGGAFLGRGVGGPGVPRLGRRLFAPHGGPDQVGQLPRAHLGLRVEPAVLEDPGVELAAVLLEDEVPGGRVVDEGAQDRGPVEHSVAAGPQLAAQTRGGEVQGDVLQMGLVDIRRQPPGHLDRVLGAYDEVRHVEADPEDIGTGGLDQPDHLGRGKVLVRLHIEPASALQQHRAQRGQRPLDLPQLLAVRR